MEEHVTVSVIGTGDGGVHPPPSGTMAVTPVGQPNLLINVVSPIIAILVRFAHVWLVSFVGLITAAGIGIEGAAVPVALNTAIKGAALTSTLIAGVETLKNLITIFGRLEGKWPLATGSI